MKKLLFGLVFIAIIGLFGCTSAEIDSFEDCVSAGNPMMESYPRQCMADGETFVEEIEEQADHSSICTELGGNYIAEHEECEYISSQGCQDMGGRFDQCASACRHSPGDVCTMQCVPVCYLGGDEDMLTEAEAVAVAEASGCANAGELTGEIMYNENSKTFWIGLEPYQERQGCDPACVVDPVAKSAEVNWRCTGLIEP